jgi:regulator of nucleoside diphosphate kinase
MMSSRKGASARPSLLLGETDAARLSALAIRAETSNPEVAELLLRELERAEVRPDAKVPATVVGMNAMVEFVDETRGQTRQVQLVYPGEADMAAGKISVMTPVGAGRIGLSAGQSIDWPDRDGRARTLRVVRVSRTPLPAPA